MHVDVAVPRRRVHHRHLGHRLQRVLQPLAPARDDQVHQPLLGRQLPELLAAPAGQQRHRRLRQPRGRQRLADQPGQHPVRSLGGARAAQHHRVPALQAERGGVDGHVRPRLVDDPDHAQRRPLLLHLQPVLERPALGDLAHRVLELGDLAHPRRHLGDARLGQRQPVDQRLGQPLLAPGLDVGRVRLQQLRGARLDAVGEVAQAGVLGGPVRARQLVRSLLRRDADVVDALGDRRHHEKTSRRASARGRRRSLLASPPCADWPSQSSSWGAHWPPESRRPTPTPPSEHAGPGREGGRPSLSPCRRARSSAASAAAASASPSSAPTPPSAPPASASRSAPATTAPAPPWATIVAIEGGPGYSSTGTAFKYSRASSAASSRRRDLVLVDSRGTGLSDALTCGNSQSRQDRAARRSSPTAHASSAPASTPTAPRPRPTTSRPVRRALGRRPPSCSTGTPTAPSSPSPTRTRHPGSRDAPMILDSAYPDQRREPVVPQHRSRTGMRSLAVACRSLPRDAHATLAPGCVARSAACAATATTVIPLAELASGPPATARPGPMSASTPGSPPCCVRRAKPYGAGRRRPRRHPRLGLRAYSRADGDRLQLQRLPDALEEGGIRSRTAGCNCGAPSRPTPAAASPPSPPTRSAARSSSAIATA